MIEQCSAATVLLRVSVIVTDRVVLVIYSNQALLFHNFIQNAILSTGTLYLY